MARIGVAMSGGGHRAALFAAGAMMYLVDAGKNVDMTSVASVSGGSLTNGFIAQSMDLPSVTPDEFDKRLKPLVHCIAQTGTVFPPSPVLLAYLIVLGIVALSSIVGVWFLSIPVAFRVLLFLVGLVITGWLAGLRGLMTRREFARLLFSPKGRPTRLDEISRSVDHVICTTDLHAGENVYFSGGFVSSFRFGWGKPGELPLHVAVQSSACLPGGFPPNWLPTGRHDFEQPLPQTEGTTRMVLVDGGVYDNQADQWVIGMRNRRKRFENVPAATFRDADELISVNASGGLGWAKLSPLLRFPLLGEFMSLMVDQSVLYDNGNSVRRELMISLFTKPGTRLHGALVHIPRNALSVATQYTRDPAPDDEDGPKPDPAARARAEEVLATFGPDKDQLAELAHRAGSTKTSLSKLGQARSADLLEHGYLLAMVNLHIILEGYPLLPRPDRSRFDALAS
jgi:predicted acylesterase/phospholipase RssA